MSSRSFAFLDCRCSRTGRSTSTCSSIPRIRSPDSSTMRGTDRQRARERTRGDSGRIRNHGGARRAKSSSRSGAVASERTGCGARAQDHAADDGPADERSTRGRSRASQLEWRPAALEDAAVVLRPARSDGRRRAAIGLGPVGGRIVAETFVRMLKRDADSFHERPRLHAVVAERLFRERSPSPTFWISLESSCNER